MGLMLAIARLKSTQKRSRFWQSFRFDGRLCRCGAEKTVPFRPAVPFCSRGDCYYASDRGKGELAGDR